MTLAFYAALRNGGLDWPLLTQYFDVARYFDAHLVEYVSTQLFFVGLAALGVRLFGLIGQFSATKVELLGAVPAGGQPVSDAPELLRRLESAPESFHSTLIYRRLRDGLEYVRDTDSADTLEEHLHRLEDVELERMSSGYGLPRLVRATLPIVGMLGTVIGITLAIGQLSPDQLEDSLTSVMAALSVAFDTTAQAMSLMLVLWFAMFFAEQIEERLLAKVDRAASRALVGRFQQYGAATDPNVASIRRMGEQVVTAVEQLTVRQSQAWESVFDATHAKWAETTAATGETVAASIRKAVSETAKQHGELLGATSDRFAASVDGRLAKTTDALDATSAKFAAGVRDGLATMAELLVESLREHGRTLSAAEERLATENRKHLSEVEAALGESMVVSADRQEKLIRQSERLLNDVRDALTHAASESQEERRSSLERTERLLSEMRETLSSATGAAAEHQEQLVKQSEVLLRVVESTGEVQRLEDALNRNLATLGQSHDFEATLVSLSAAVQLLTSRLGRDGGAAGSSTGKAA